MQLKFTAVCEEAQKHEGGGYVAYAQELPGAITQGETLEEARENLRDAIERLLEANRELSRETQSGHSVIHEEIAISVPRNEPISHLREHGCELLREGAKHSVDVNRAAHKTSTVPRHVEIKNPTAIKICRQLGVPDPQK